MQAGAGSDKEMEMSEIIRLDKYLADMGCGTRSQVKQMIRKGQVEINGEKNLLDLIRKTRKRNPL